jgi:hypothetical protein
MEPKRTMERRQSQLVAHPELHISKQRIFAENDPKLRKTKIICTIGYYNFTYFKIDLQVVALRC